MKKVYFLTNHELSAESLSGPIRYKRVNKSSQKSVDSGDCEQRTVTRYILDKIKDHWLLPIHITDNRVPVFPTLDQDRS